MKRSNLPRILLASMMAGLSVGPTVRQTAAQPARIVDANARGQRSDPISQAILGGVTANVADVYGSGLAGVSPHQNIWPHNRPLPGWRKVQSVARHKERMRRQRHNA